METTTIMLVIVAYKLFLIIEDLNIEKQLKF